jgi:hypothetical protein
MSAGRVVRDSDVMTSKKAREQSEIVGLTTRLSSRIIKSFSGRSHE